MISSTEVNKEFWRAYVDELLANKYNYSVSHSATSIERKFIKDLEGKKVFHIFCNFGMNSFVLEEAGAEVVGLDYNDKAIEYADQYKKVISSNAKFVCDDFFTHDIKSEYDVVFASFGVLDWVEDVDEFIDRVYRSLKPSGRFIFVEFTSDFFLNYFLQRGGVKYGENQYEVQTDIVTRVGTPSSSLLGNGYTSEENAICRPFVHNTDRFLDKIEEKGFTIDRLEYFDHINFKMGHDILIGDNRFRNKDLKDNQKMCYGMVCSKELDMNTEWDYYSGLPNPKAYEKE